MTNPIWQRSIQRIVQTLIILLTLYYTLLGGFFVGVHQAQWRTVTYVISALLLGGWLLWRLRRKQPWPHTPLDWPLLAVMVTTLITTVTSTDPRLSFDSLLMILAYSLCFYFAIDLTRSRALSEKIINGILITALVICLVGLFEYWQWLYGDWLADVNRSQIGIPWSLRDSRRIKSVLHSPNVLAYYLLLILGLLLYKFSRAQRLWLQLAWGGWALFVLAMIILTQSRGGLAGAIGVLAIFLGLRLLIEKRGATSLFARLRAPLWRTILIAALAGGAFLLVWPLVTRSLKSGFNWGQRDDIWRIALNAIAAHPWLGSGPGTFGQQYLIFRQVESDFIHSHAHNLWLTFMAETGAVGLVAVLALNLTFLWIVPRLLRQVDTTQSTLLIGALAALGGVSLHNLVDDFLDYPMLTLHVIFLVALSLNVAPTAARPQTFFPTRWPNTRNIAAIGFAVMIGSAAFWFQPAFAAYDRARAAAAEDDWQQAARHLEQAVAADHGSRFYRQQLALVYGRLTPGDVSLLPQAVALQTDLLRHSDHYPLDYANLACLHQQAGNLAEAIWAMEQAVARQPARNRGPNLLRVSRLAYQFSLVQLYEQAGETDAAQKLLVQILKARPWVAASPFWDDRPVQLQVLVSAINNAASPISSQDLAELADLHFYAGNYRQAILIGRQLLNNEGSVSNLVRLGRTLAAVGELEVALTTINQALATSPYHSGAHLVRAQIYAQQGKLEAAEADIQVVVALSPSAEVYTFWGQLAEQRGALTEAKQRYKQAVYRSVALQTNYAHLIARREPLPEETLDCVIAPYTYKQLSQPVFALGRLLEAEGNRDKAGEVYELLLHHEPYNQAVSRQLQRVK